MVVGPQGCVKSGDVRETGGCPGLFVVPTRGTALGRVRVCLGAHFYDENHSTS